jgi:hypothetical protein
MGLLDKRVARSQKRRLISALKLRPLRVRRSSEPLLDPGKDKGGGP